MCKGQSIYIDCELLGQVICTVICMYENSVNFYKFINVSLSQVEEAGQVFLLMKKDYRISRNVRLAWFLNHLHQTVQATPQEMLVRPRDMQDARGWLRRSVFLRGY